MKQSRIFTPEEEAYIVETYLSTKKLADLRSEFKTSADLIKNVLNKNGVVVSLRKSPVAN